MNEEERIRLVHRRNENLLRVTRRAAALHRLRDLKAPPIIIERQRLLLWKAFEALADDKDYETNES